jgi:hypothetical protein
VSQEDLHRDFPFDSRSFDFTLDFSTELPFDFVNLINRVPGFYVPCETVSATWFPRELRIRFDLKRNRLIQLFVVVVAVIALVYPLIIIQLADVLGEVGGKHGETPSR